MSMITLENPKIKTRNIKFKKCGHQQEMTFTLTSEEEYENYLELFNGINDYCDKCKITNTEYGMIRELNTGNSDTRITHYTFNHADIKKVIRYFYKHGISLHNEYYHINSMYDCTGNCFARYVKVKKFKNHITVRFSYHYDY